ncbi:ABC transporter permease [Halovenus sp. WSH3]|uniref:ABC transporter permease n=1 Tax=Halovenus carboxidivorans TaxID=2692199 RepID=A0A6B0T6V8_9EURY|nr:ABC transporter permease [Halovenus carboxidivorans]MXR51936.1 ABC transporter permease [Halovenus carboxidivorans]
MNVEVDLTARESTPRWLAYGAPVFTVLAALAVSALVLLVVDVSPVDAYSMMFYQTITTQIGAAQTLITTVPLVLAGLAVYLPLKAGLFNIGAEGQLVIGALAGTWVGLNVSLPGYALVPLMFVVAGLAGGFLAAIPAWLRARYDVNEIITSLLLSFVALEILSYVVRGPMRGSSGNFPQTAQLPAAARIPELFMRVHVGLFVALLVVAAVSLLMRRSRLGFEITFMGSNDAAAVQAGMSRIKVYLLVFVLGGAFAGMGGISEIAGVQGRLRAGFEPGYGFTAIPIALLGRNSAVQVLLASLFFALLFTGGTNMEIFLGIPAALVEVIQALIILFLITGEFFKRYRIDVSVERGSVTPDTAGGDA